MSRYDMARYCMRADGLSATQLLENAPETRCNPQEVRVKEGHPINRVLRMRASGLGWNGLVRDMRQPPPRRPRRGVGRHCGAFCACREQEFLF